MTVNSFFVGDVPESWNRVGDTHLTVQGEIVPKGINPGREITPDSGVVKFTNIRLNCDGVYIDLRLFHGAELFHILNSVHNAITGELEPAGLPILKEGDIVIATGSYRVGPWAIHDDDGKPTGEVRIRHQVTVSNYRSIKRGKPIDAKKVEKMRQQLIKRLSK
jgi:hypothetical protein